MGGLLEKTTHGKVKSEEPGQTTRGTIVQKCAEPKNKLNSMLRKMDKKEVKAYMVKMYEVMRLAAKSGWEEGWVGQMGEVRVPLSNSR